ncbi:RICIN domain-containing protein [Kitasatospora sp. NBC_01266]|uniref:RICIN domain-containing protein n=1 Tax=Kitasatospora sp. NBC_01266 TaxID=2903572 RepID=UPI002E3076EF|nr:RICIN domain-containing protein [Kitasatospora sp. NBC_01266]
MSKHHGSTRLKQTLGVLVAAATVTVMMPAANASADVTDPHTGDTIRNVNSKLCLEIADWSTSNGAAARQWQCTGGDNQKWIFKDGQFVNLHSGLCLEIADWSTSDGAAARQWQCTGGDNQKWEPGNANFPEQSSVLEDTVWFAYNVHSAKCLEIPAWSTDWGTQADQWDQNGGINQLWAVGSAPIWQSAT